MIQKIKIKEIIKEMMKDRLEFRGLCLEELSCLTHEMITAEHYFAYINLRGDFCILST